MMGSREQCPVILMLPWLAHGHLSPFVELAKKLSQRNFHIYICSSPINLKPFREDLSHNLNSFSSIKLLDIHLPSSPQLPPHYHTTKHLPPHLISALKTAFDHVIPTFCDLLATLNPDLLIYDFLQPWAPFAAQEQGIKAVLFLACGAASCSFLTHCCKYPDQDFPFPSFKDPNDQRQNIVQFMDNASNGLSDKQRFLGCVERSASFILIKTSKEIEAKYIDYLSTLAGKEVVPVGPLFQSPTNNHEDTKTMEWLSKKDSTLTVYVSFGSEYFLSKEEIEEVAIGLELSGVSFIWVVRFHGGEKTRAEEVLPEGFLNRVGERGLVIEGWAPQAKILGHESIGGFVSHCGWSSIMESLICGVPIIAMPLHLDQPLNAKLIVEMGVGLEVNRENGKFKSDELARVIRNITCEDKGKEVRRKVKQLSERVREKGDREVDVMVEKLVQVIGK